jgi:hypothetical protein
VREDITVWVRNLQNKTTYKFACSGQRLGGTEDDCTGVQILQRIVVFGRRRRTKRGKRRPFTDFIFLKHEQKVKRFL